ncbi:MAG: hypothetical protein ACXW1P_09775, partial [Methylophilaceae bacterium]
SFDEYIDRAPADHSQWKIVPVEPRPFPNHLREGLALKQDKPAQVPWSVALVSLGLVLLVIWGLRKLMRKPKPVLRPSREA